ncbi:MAG: TolC family protein [Candidatus Binatia bacterium]
MAIRQTARLLRSPSLLLLGGVVSAFGLLFCPRAPAEALSVEDCVRLALARSPAIHAAGFDIDAAAARVNAARAAYAPRLLAEGEYGHSEGFDDVVTNGGSTAVLLTLQATLLDGGLRDAQFAAARARLQSANAIEQQRRADVALAVRSAYFAALAARAETGIHRGNARMLRDYVALLQRQEDLGLAFHTDVLRAQLAVETARSARRASAAQLATARSQLSALSGIEVTVESLIEPTAMPLAEATGAMIDASPVMVDASATVEAARRESDAVRSERHAHMTLTASGGALGVRPAPTFRDNGGGQFLLGFTVPLYDGGGTAARVAAAAAAAKNAEANLKQSRQEITVALARAAAEARRAQGDVVAWRRTIPKAEDNFQLLRARYFGGGNVRLLEVLDALTQYVDARLNVPRAFFAYRVAIATREQILGAVPQ